MALSIERELLEVHTLSKPEGGVVLRFEYPGLSAFCHHVSQERSELPLGAPGYRPEDLFWLVASMRYEAVYDEMSAHEKLEVQAAIVAAKARRARVDP